MPSNRVARECHICRRDKDNGEDVRMTMYVKLSQHLRTVHGMAGAEARRRVKDLRSPTSKKSAGGRYYFKCSLDGCDAVVVKRSDHLKSSRHRLPVGSQEYSVAYENALKRYRPAGHPLRRSPQPVATTGSSDSAASEDLFEPYQDEPMPNQNEDALRLMQPGDCVYDKWQCLIPIGFKPFDVVHQWYEFKTQRAGGNRAEARQAEDMGYVNRFLASCAFDGGFWDRVTRQMVERHDQVLSKTYKPGTVSRIFQTLLDFWKWSLAEKYIDQQLYDHVEQYITGCLKSTRKDVARRNTMRHVEEANALPLPEIYREFQESQYVLQASQKFLRAPFTFLYDMACILLVLMSFYNGTRPSVLRNIRCTDVDSAYMEDGVTYTISGGRHKTDYTGRSAFITLSKKVYGLLKKYKEAVTNTIRLDPTATVFRKRDLSPIDTNDVNKMAKRAWSKAGMTSDFNMTINRKLITVVGRKADPTKAGQIANLLLHRQNTAHRFYAVHDDRDNERATYRDLEKAFAPTKTTAPTATVTSADHRSDELRQPEVSRDSDRDSETLDVIPITSTPVDSNTTRKLIIQLFPSFEDDNTIRNEASQTTSQELDIAVEPEITSQDSEQIGYVSGTTSGATERETQPLVEEVTDGEKLVATLLMPMEEWPERKPKLHISPQIWAEIKDAYLETILIYMMSTKTVPMAIIRNVQEGLWPELSDRQLREVVRNIIKKEAKVQRQQEEL